MSVEIDCPKCRKRYPVPPAAAGKRLKCKACGETLVAGASKTQADDVLEPAWGDTAKPAVATAPTAGMPTTIGRFAIRGKLGAGAFGTVYRAYDPQLDRVVALKVPNPGVMTDAKRAERFLREAKAAANLHHPHIVPVFDAGKDGDTLYIASAFIGGKPLSDAIPEGGTDFPRAARLARELAEALAYAHEQGIVHRDVKPQNVMLDTLDRVHLMDFGLASRQEEAGRLTNDGAVMGTPAYMSPEQARGQKGDAQPPTDQYAAGVVLYELLTGRTPFSGPPAVVIAAVLTAEPDPPRTHRPNVPKDLETICLKALAKHPEDRYPDCQNLADDLRRWLGGEPISARRMSLRERAARWVEKEPGLAGASATLAVVFLVSFILISVFARRLDMARRQAEATVAQAEQDAATAKAAEKRAADALAEARTARAREERAAGERLGALGSAAEERTKVETLQRALAEERKKTAALQAKAAALQAQLNAAEVATLKGHTDEVQSASFSSDGSRVVTGGADKTAKVWDAQTGAEVLTLRGHTDVVASASFSADGSRVVTGGWDWMARVWDAQTGAEVLALKGHTGWVASASFSADGSRVVTGGWDGAAKVWDAKTGREVLALKGHTGGVRSASFSSDGSRVVTGGADKTAKVWDAQTGAEVLTLKGHTDVVTSASFSADGSRVVTGGWDGAAKVWDAKTGREVLALKGHTGGVRSASFSSDGSRVVTGGADKTAKVWDAQTGAEVLTLKGHTSRVNETSFSPDGARIVTASADNTAKVWNAKTGESGK
jgi:predicted oxidoreductase (fatty acid repression mutant protein)